MAIPAIARSCPLLDFELGDMLQIRSSATGVTQRVEPAMVVGLETYVRNYLLVNGAFESFAIQFRPAALKQLFGLPMHELANQHYAAHAVFGPKVWKLRQRLGEAHSFEERVQLANAFIVELSSGRPVNDSIELAANEIFRSQGNCKIDTLAHYTGFSMRNFQRRFREYLGISPKLYARIVRFESVLKTKSAAPHISWMNAAHEAGYHDQMHMVHDFREFSGQTDTNEFHNKRVEPVEGSWIFSVKGLNGSYAFTAVASFTAGGVFLATGSDDRLNPASPLHGTWRRAGRDRFDATADFFGFDQTGNPTAMNHIVQSFELNDDGELIGVGEFSVCDVQGRALPQDSADRL